LYHGEFGLINRTFGVARRTCVTDRQVARLLFSTDRQWCWRIDRSNRRTTGRTSAKPRQLVRLSCAGCAFVDCVATARRL